MSGAAAHRSGGDDAGGGRTGGGADRAGQGDVHEPLEIMRSHVARRVTSTHGALPCIDIPTAGLFAQVSYHTPRYCQYP